MKLLVLAFHATLFGLALVIVTGCSGRLKNAQLSYDRSHDKIVVKRKLLLSSRQRVIGYDEHGRLSYKGQVMDTTKVGRWEYFNYDGLLVARFQYENGVVVRSMLINRGDMWER